jgi:hypothetical protein
LTLSELTKSIKSESIRVHAPSSVVFLCGGAINPGLPDPVVLRDAFLRAAKVSGANYQIILAEDAKPLTTEAGYNNLLSFESDIAQLVGLILLFVESAGSLAELGAFAALDEVAPKLLAVLNDFHYGESSFVRNGPVKFLENEHGDESILVLDRAHVGLAADGTIDRLEATNFGAAVLPAVTKRLDARPKFVKFDSKKHGHAILLLVGLCQEFGALTQTEIKQCLEYFGITEIRLSNFLYCAELLGWIVRVRKGNNIFFVATAGEPALDYQFADGVTIREKSRWRTDIRANWKVTEPARFRAIAEIAVASVAP